MIRMKIDSGKAILMIEPANKPSLTPVIDDLTLKCVYIVRHATDRRKYRGFHKCSCGARSSNERLVFDNKLTNSLCAHYMAYHRGEVPQEEIDYINSLDVDVTLPTEKELKGWR